MSKKWVEQAVERLYEDEQLRAGLPDEAATALLGWAERQLAAADGPERARFDAAARAIATTARGAAIVTRERRGLGREALRQRLAALVSPREALGGALAAEVDALAAEGAALADRAWLERLLALLEGREPARVPASPVRMVAPAPAPPAPRPTFGALANRTRMVALAAVGLPLLLCGCALAAGWWLFGREGEPEPVVAPPRPRATRAIATQPPAVADWYQLFFTEPIFPDDPALHTGSIDLELASFIASARTSVDVAIYQLDLPAVTDALRDAHERGATVRVVTDVDTLLDDDESAAFDELSDAGIEVVAGNANDIMHNKFVVVDEAAVWTGSWNFTENDTYRYNNNAILIESPELARNYTVTFEKMWADEQFGARRDPGGTRAQITVQGTLVESYFAPEDEVTDKLLARLAEADESIRFMAFSFTDDDIGALLRERAEAGVEVAGVFETVGSQTEFSEWGPLRDAGLPALQDGNPYLMHHKVFIVDGEMVILGSFNFSQNANTGNDENLLIIHDSALAAAYTDEWTRVFTLAENPLND